MNSIPAILSQKHDKTDVPFTSEPDLRQQLLLPQNRIRVKNVRLIIQSGSRCWVGLPQVKFRMFSVLGVTV